jgi:hypothetical protein
MKQDNGHAGSTAPRQSASKPRNTAARCALLAVTVLVLPAAFSAVQADPSGRTAVAHQAMEWTADGKTAKLEFDFGDFRGWGRRDGSWNIEGEISHRGLLCATYSLALRIGHGSPGCDNVEWFGKPRTVGSKYLCNNASGTLASGDLTFSNTDRFDEITCAERIITCSGNCK